MSTFHEKVQLMLEQAALGRLGTPDNPDRSSSLHHHFWEGYLGWRKPDEFPQGSPARACCQAGVEWRNQS